MNNLFETMIYSQIFGGGLGGAFGGQLWLYVAYLVCLFAVIIYKPERIRNLSMYRRACYLFAISLLLPSLITLAMGTVLAGTGGAAFASRGAVFAQPGMFSGQGGPNQFDGSYVMQLALQVLNAFGPVLFAISILCALISLVPSFIPPPEHELIGSEPYEPRRFRPPGATGLSGKGSGSDDVPVS